MAADLVSPSDYGSTLTAAAIAFRRKLGDQPSPKAVLSALVQAEKAAKQQRLTYAFESLWGQWQLCFTANRKAHERHGIMEGSGWYVPRLASAQISFSNAPDSDRPGSGEIANQLKLGSLLLRFTGPCQFLGKKNLLSFDFTQIQICLLKRTVYQREIRGGNTQKQAFQTYQTPSRGKLPFFAFFLITEELIAARGRGGGLALWIRTEN
ncbi:MAG: hypothetical protein WCA35_16075 [Kovacikia sp.]